jgi:hypothetical protein
VRLCKSPTADSHLLRWHGPASTSGTSQIQMLDIESHSILPTQ